MLPAILTIGLGLLVGPVQAQVWPQKLDCNTLTGVLADQWIQFARPMEVGDVISVTGLLPPVIVDRGASINLCQNYAFDHISLHVRFDKNRMCYNSMEQPSKWGNEEFGPTIFGGGNNFKIVIKKLYDSYEIHDHSGSLVFLKKFTFRHPPDRPIQWLVAHLNFVNVRAVQMQCVRPSVPPPPPPPPPPPVNPPRPPPPRPPHGGYDGHHHHPHHPHDHYHGDDGYGGGGGGKRPSNYDSSSSSGSDECDE